MSISLFLSRIYDKQAPFITCKSLSGEVHKLMACFYSESEDMAYWSEVPCKKGERFSIGDSSSIVTDLKIDELTNYMFEEYKSIYKSGYEANKIGWQQALIKWKSDFNAEVKDGFKWEDKPFVLICEVKRINE